MADPICRWRNATPETVCELVHELPKTEMSSEDFREFMNKSKFGKAFFTSAYQLACQLGLYVETDIYRPRFSDDISIDEASAYLKMWFSKYYVPNPYTKKGFDNLSKPVFLEESFVEYIKSNEENCNLTEAYKEIFKEDEIGEMDIFVNAFKAYSSKILLKEKDPLVLTDGKKIKQFSLSLKGDYKKMNVEFDRNDKESFFDNFGNIANKASKIQLPKNNARSCAKRIIEILWNEDNLLRVVPFFKYGKNLSITNDLIKPGTLANVFCTNESSNYTNKTRTFQEDVYEFENNDKKYITKLTTQWQGFKTEQPNYEKDRTYLWALRDFVNTVYKDIFYIENNGEEAWITYLKGNQETEIPESKKKFLLMHVIKNYLTKTSIIKDIL